MANEYLAVGKVINTHGVKGELKVMPLTSDVSRFDYLLFVTVQWEGKPKEFRVTGARIHKNSVLLKLSGIDSMDDAEKLKGQELLVERKHARPLDEDEYFIFDIIDMTVYEKDKLLGKISDVIETGSNDVYVIKSENGKELLLPALKSVILKVDLEAGRMEVKVPEGLNDEV